MCKRNWPFFSVKSIWRKFSWNWFHWNFSHSSEEFMVSSACTFFKCLLVTIVISEFLAWLLFLKTRLCKEKKATHTFICWVFVATKKNIKTTKKNLKKTKTNKTQKNSSRIFWLEKKIFFFSSPFKHKK